MPESTVVKNKRDGTIAFSDLGAANSFTVAFEAGDLSLTIPGTTVSNYLDRGTMVPSLRLVDDQPITGSFTAYLRDFSDAAYATLMELITLTGDVGANWTSTGSIAPVVADVFLVDLTWTVAGVIHGDASDHVIELNFCHLTGATSEGDPDTITINFTSYTVYPTVT
jgi:hypothetical protein